MTSSTHAGRMALATLVVAGLFACGGDPGPPTDSDGSTTAAPTAAPTAALSDACGPVEYPAVQLGGHLIGDAPPPNRYSSVPPTSGWHANTAPAPGKVYDTLTDPQIVAALEVGTVVVAVSPDVDATDASQLVAQFDDRLLVTTHSGDMPTPVALLTWGKLARCTDLDPTGVTSFVLGERVVQDAH